MAVLASDLRSVIAVRDSRVPVDVLNASNKQTGQGQSEHSEPKRVHALYAGVSKLLL